MLRSDWAKHPFLFFRNPSPNLIEFFKFTSLRFLFFVHNENIEGQRGCARDERETSSLGILSHFIIGNNVEFIYAKDRSRSKGINCYSRGSHPLKDFGQQ